MNLSFDNSISIFVIHRHGLDHFIVEMSSSPVSDPGDKSQITAHMD